MLKEFNLVKEGMKRKPGTFLGHQPAYRVVLNITYKGPGPIENLRTHMIPLAVMAETWQDAVAKALHYTCSPSLRSEFPDIHHVQIFVEPIPPDWRESWWPPFYQVTGTTALVRLVLWHTWTKCRVFTVFLWSSFICLRSIRWIARVGGSCGSRARRWLQSLWRWMRTRIIIR